MITASGIGSGLDVSGIVAQLVEAERAPKTFLLDRREAFLQAQVSAFGTLKSALLDLRSALGGLDEAADFNRRSASSSDDSLFTGSASSAAVSGSYQVVVDQLAQSRKLSSQGFGSTAATVGSGLLTFTVGEESLSVDIAATAGSVADIRDAVNGASDNALVTATVVNVDDGNGGLEARLLFAATGAEDLVISADDVDGDDTNASGLSQLVFEAGVTENMQSVQAPTRARVFIDQLLVESDSNTVVDAIEGVTLELVAAEAGVSNTLTVSNDTFAIKQAMQGFADAYNDYVGTASGLTQVSTPEESGLLVGDATLRNVQAQLRREFSVRTVADFTGTLPGNMAEMGFTTRDDGTLAFDAGAFEAQLQANPDAVSDYFSGENGLGSRLGTLLDGFLQGNGALDARTNRLDGEIDRIADARAQLELRVQATERRLLAQFSAMDSLVAQLNATSDFLTQQLDSLSSITTNR